MWRSWGTCRPPTGTWGRGIDRWTTHGGSDFARAQWLPRAGTERRFPAAFVLPVVAMALAGGGESRLPRTRRCDRGIRPVCALAIDHDADSVRHRAARVREAGPGAGLHPVQRIPARRLPVRLLWLPRGPDVRPRDPALE